MSIGTAIRQLFGQHEHGITEAYRRIFVDLDDLIAIICAKHPTASHVLEVGCGEGALAERLVTAYPRAEILGVDVSPRIGRLYRGDPSRVEFRQAQIDVVASECAGKFDLVILCDVLHHVPQGARTPLLLAIRRALAPGGLFVLKEWAPSLSLQHLLCATSDRVLTGDRVSYLKTSGTSSLLASVFDATLIQLSPRTIAPHANNYVFFVKSSCATG
ncbi:methyltransferase [Neoroseomonas soli]|uniref:Methyltransferase domain-containing protein n=1 Tax=Neoroseomonas soli TaxID=1081025 RepID=A0A9X9X4L8_9PROT|nr:methyltransferase domain-containing protein [Neoroseomonas soli]